MTKFCTDCGKKIEYKFNPPNFCPNCGASLKARGSKQPESTESKISANVSKSSADSEGYTDASYIPSISRLEYDIEDFGATSQQTIGSLGGKQSPRKWKNSTRRIDDL